MANFSKRNDPKVINNLSSEHANFNNTNTPLYKPQPFDKKDSSSFHQEKILYQNNMIPDYKKLRKRQVEMPKEEYTKEEKLIRPIADKDTRLNIESNQKENLKFSKSVSIDNMKFDSNPVDQVFQNALTTNEDIIFDNNDNYQKPKKNILKKIMPFIIIGVVIEIIVVLVLLFFNYFGKTDTLECSSETYNEFYQANIQNIKKYTFKNGKITKLLDTTYYKFDNNEVYESFKKEYAYPEYSIIKGRVVTYNIDDNTNIYEEQISYDYTRLRKQNTSSDKHTIVIGNENDSINLIDYNIKDIKIIYSDDYKCR